MGRAPYQHSQEQLILRDYLAAERTALANERTFLSYIRTALGFAAVGATVVHFFEALAIDVVGWFIVAAAVILRGIGVSRYIRVKRYIKGVTPKGG